MQKNRSNGFSLIELMVYLVLSMVIALGVTSTVITTKQTSNLTSAVNKIQDTGRDILSLLNYQIQNAGFVGACVLLNLDNTSPDISNFNTLPYNVKNAPVVGWDTKPTSFFSDLTDWAEVGNIVLVQYASNNDNEYNNAADNDGVVVSDLNISSCQQATRADIPGNIDTEDLTVTKRGYVIHSYLYYLARGSNQTTAETLIKNTSDIYVLKRLKFNTRNGISFSTVTEETVADGVRDFRIEYGTSAFSQDGWLTASKITSKNQWNNVKIVRISLVVGDSRKNVLTNNKTIRFYNGAPDTQTIGKIEITGARAADVFTKVIDIRNRSL